MKKEENEPQIDESLLTPAQKEEMKHSGVNVPSLIFFGVLLLLIVACLIVIAVLPKLDSPAPFVAIFKNPDSVYPPALARLCPALKILVQRVERYG